MVAIGDSSNLVIWSSGYLVIEFSIECSIRQSMTRQPDDQMTRFSYLYRSVTDVVTNRRCRRCASLCCLVARARAARHGDPSRANHLDDPIRPQHFEQAVNLILGAGRFN